MKSIYYLSTFFLMAVSLSAHRTSAIEVRGHAVGPSIRQPVTYIVSSSDGSVTGIDGWTGRILWSFDTGGSLVGAVQGDSQFVAAFKTADGDDSHGSTNSVDFYIVEGDRLSNRGSLDRVVGVPPQKLPDGSLLMASKVHKEFSVDYVDGLMNTDSNTTLDIIRHDITLKVKKDGTESLQTVGNINVFQRPHNCVDPLSHSLSVPRVVVGAGDVLIAFNGNDMSDEILWKAKLPSAPIKLHNVTSGYMKEMRLVFQGNEAACLQEIEGKPFLVTTLSGEGRSLHALGIRHNRDLLIENNGVIADDDDLGSGALVPLMHRVRQGNVDANIHFLDVLPDIPYFDYNNPDHGLVNPVQKPTNTSSSPIQSVRRIALKLFNIPPREYFIAALTLLFTYIVWMSQSLRRFFFRTEPSPEPEEEDTPTEATSPLSTTPKGVVTYQKAGLTGEREVAVADISSPEVKPVMASGRDVVTFQKAGITGERSRKSSGEGGLLRSSRVSTEGGQVPSIDVVLLLSNTTSTSLQFSTLINTLRNWSHKMLQSENCSLRVGVIQFSGDSSAGRANAKTTPRGVGTGGKLSMDEEEVNADFEWHLNNCTRDTESVIEKGISLAIEMFENSSDAEQHKVIVVVSNSCIEYMSPTSKEEVNDAITTSGVRVFDIGGGQIASSEEDPDREYFCELLQIEEVSLLEETTAVEDTKISNSLDSESNSSKNNNKVKTSEQTPAAEHESSSESSSDSDSDSSSGEGKLGNRVFQKPSKTATVASDDSDSSSSSGGGKLGSRVFKNTASPADQKTTLFRQQSDSSSSSSSGGKLGNRVFKNCPESDYSDSTRGGQRNWDNTLNSSYFRDGDDCSRGNTNTNQEAVCSDSTTTRDTQEVETPPSTYQLNYNEIRDIGGGGYGSVWLAENKTDKKHYAVKKIRLRSRDDEDRTMREASMHASFDHPNIARYNFSWEEELSLEETLRAASAGGGTSETITRTLTTLVGNRNCLHSRRHLFIAMKYYGEGSLKDWLNNRTTVCSKENCQLMLQLIEGLLHLHDNEVLHRDMKPSNVLVDRTTKGKMILKICDFGLSVIKRSDWEPLGVVLQEENQTTGVAGTPLYASPEQQNNGTYGRHSDIYSLGAIYFELFMERPTDSERIIHLQSLKYVSFLYFSFKTNKSNNVINNLTEQLNEKTRSAKNSKRNGKMTCC